MCVTLCSDLSFSIDLQILVSDERAQTHQNLTQLQIWKQLCMSETDTAIRRSAIQTTSTHKTRDKTTMMQRIWVLCVLCVLPVTSFVVNQRVSTRVTPLNLFGGSSGKIPSSPNERDSMAISAIKAAINKPRTPGFGLIECEFPPLAALNKLGDGSLRSAKEVDAANLKFAKKLIQSITPLPLLGPKVWFLTCASAPASFATGAKQAGATPHSLRDGLPNVAASDVCLLVSPSSRSDYEAATRLASLCKAAVVVNGFAKDTSSIPARATMAYFLKPLTYNSQVVGYLTRAYPGPWTTIDLASKEVLASADDDQILVRGTNTPDLRASGKLVQKVVDDRAIKARQR